MNLTLLGLGAMGARMARRLLDAGHALTVWNRSPERAKPLVEAGARLAESPRAAAEGAALVLSMLTDDEASRAVWLHPERGAALGLGPEAMAVECSTVTPAWIHELGAHLAPRALLDAPVVGTLPHAESGQLKLLVGGDAAALVRARPALEALGPVYAVGALGHGAALKLAVNTMFAVQAAALSEQLAALEAAGLPLGRSLEVLGEMPTASPVAKLVGQLIEAGRYAPLFPVSLVEKDLGYAAAQGAQMPLTEVTRAVFRRAMHAGLGGENINAVAKLYRGG
ncbi:MAG: NAD(P)-dependent oxidoreductase [Alphaproteobacteria bacterium]|nr:NAD(P)-dependent oxidoreductase [Alphaproteobacteria bacterium]MCB9794027.1 NAD(P)-dependent oxidoreductase [Alphaproteobacteria bacterium]